MTETQSRGFARDVLLATLTSLAVAIALIIVTSVLARRLGPVEFGVYSLARRFAVTVASVTNLAMGVAVARYIAIAADLRSRWRI